VRRESDLPVAALRTPIARPVSDDLWSERRRFGFGGVILAAVVGEVLASIHFNLPWSGSMESALSAMLIANLLWGLVTYGSVVVILSIGRRGIDVLLLRAMLVAFVLGAGFFVVLLVTPLPATSRVPALLIVATAGLIAAGTLGPILATYAILANLLWYRSLTSLRPQLGIFNRVQRPLEAGSDRSNSSGVSSAL
jgi:hypothetical protein